MALAPPTDKQDWRDQTLFVLASQMEVVMASLTELTNSLGQLNAKVDQLESTEGAQTAAIAGLVGSVDALISMVEELKTSLSAEEQAVVDQAMASVASSLTKVDTVIAGSSSQSTEIHDLAARAEAASGGTPTP